MLSYQSALVTEDGHGPKMLADIELCGKVSALLERHYPGHNWMVGADHEAGYIVIRLLYFGASTHAGRFGYLIHINSLASDGGWRKVVRGGGEVLERFGLSRGIRKEGEAEEAGVRGLILDHMLV